MANWKHIAITWTRRTLWSAAGIGLITLLVAAMREEDAQVCQEVNISIYGVNTHFFVDEEAIMGAVRSFCGGEPEGRRITSFNLREMELALRENVWVKSVEIYFDRFHHLRISVHEREPVARVFGVDGETFYLDTALTHLPLSDSYTARLPIFTAYPGNRFQPTAADSLLLKNIVNLSLAIQRDSFSLALIDQIDIDNLREFVLIPKLGEAPIRFGDGTRAEAKLKKLQLFYQQVLAKSGLSRYGEINLSYRDQVVARLAGKEDQAIDSLRLLQMLAWMVEQAEQRAADSLTQIRADDPSNSVSPAIIEQSLERDLPDGFEGTVVVPPIAADAAVKPSPNPTASTNKPAAPTLTNQAPASSRPAAKSAVAPPSLPKPATPKPVKPATAKPPPKPKPKPQPAANTNDY